MIIAGVCFVVVVGVVWFLMRPAGVLRLAVDAQLDLSQVERQNLFGLADAQIPRIASYYSTLSFGTSEAAPVPGQDKPGSITLSDILSWQVSIELSREPVKFKGEFNGNRFMNLLYGWLGFYDFYLVITAYAPCDPGAPQGSGAHETCHRLSVFLWPLEKRAKEIRGSPSELSDQLALYLVKSFLRYDQSRNGSASPTRPILSANELSDSPRSLAEAARGLRLLNEGMHHTDCVTSTISECLHKAERAFENSLDSDRENSHALLGRGLIRIRRALDAAIAQERVFTVQELLITASNEIAAARRRSPFLAAYLDTTGAAEQFGLIRSTTFKVTANLLKTAHLYRCVDHAFRRADYEKVINYLGNIKEDMPREISPYMLGYKFEALLNVVAPGSEASAILDELYEVKDTAPDNWLYNLIYGSQACRLRGYDQLVADSFRITIQNAPSEILHYDAIIWKSYCLGINNQIPTAMSEIKRVLNFMSTLPVEREREARTLAVDLGYFYAAIRDYKSAAKYFLRSAVDPFLLARIRKDPQLRSFRDSAVYDKFIADALKQQETEKEPAYPCEGE